jgi:ribosomal protein S18 acetylase RimI-like enzyme
VPFSRESAPGGHALLADAYRSGFGSVGPFAKWHALLTSDAEFDPDLCFLYAEGGQPAGFAQVWTSSFVKDFAVASGHRRQGLGTALLLTVFAALRARGHAEVRLKTRIANQGAIAFYRACGMHIEPSEPQSA